MPTVAETGNPAAAPQDVAPPPGKYPTMTAPLPELEDPRRRRPSRRTAARGLTVSLCGVLVAGAVAWPSDRLWLLLAAAGLAAYPSGQDLKPCKSTGQNKRSSS